MPALPATRTPTVPARCRVGAALVTPLAWTTAVLAMAGVAGLTWKAPGWVMMWAIAGTQFIALKLATLHGVLAGAAPIRVLGYLAAYPGMNVRAFLVFPARHPAAATPVELAAAVLKSAIGMALFAWAVAHAHDPRALLVAWVAMLGIIFTLHFGVFHIASWLWRRAGFDAPPLMRAPIAAESVAELWNARWNLAFADAARRFLLRPLSRRVGANAAGAWVFLVSGLAHETVISLPARGGGGGPTAYFVLQALGLAVEKSATGRRLGLGRGWRGRLWTLLVAVAPLPLLFHAPFARNVVVPFVHAVAGFLLP